jgi:hypothetical protein
MPPDVAAATGIALDSSTHPIRCAWTPLRDLGADRQLGNRPTGHAYPSVDWLDRPRARNALTGLISLPLDEWAALESVSDEICSALDT